MHVLGARLGLRFAHEAVGVVIPGKGPKFYQPQTCFIELIHLKLFVFEAIKKYFGQIFKTCSNIDSVKGKF